MRRILTICFAAALLATGAGQAAATDKPRPSSAAEPGDRLICKRFTRIGSLVDSYKTCKTKSEWDREHSNLRTAGQSGSCGPRETTTGMSTTSC